MLKINFGKQELRKKLAASKFEMYLSPNHKNRPGLIFTFDRQTVYKVFWSKAEFVNDISYAVLHTSTLHCTYCLLSTFKVKRLNLFDLTFAYLLVL